MYRHVSQDSRQVELREKLLRHGEEEMNLRNKLLMQELQNLEQTLKNIESLGVPMDGLWDSMVNKAKQVANGTVNYLNGTKSAQQAYDALKGKYTNLILDQANCRVTLVANGKDVIVDCSGSKWHVTVNGATYEAKDSTDLKNVIDIHTRSTVSAAQEVVKHSRTILLARRFARVC